jgi:hypothetical protein
LREWLPPLCLPDLRIYDILFVVVQTQSFRVEQGAKPANGAADLLAWDHDNDVIHISKISLPELGFHRLVNHLQREMAE